MKRSLTIIEQMTTIPLVGETEVGSAEAQLTRDSQPGVTDYRTGGRFPTGHPAHFFTMVIQNSLMPKKTVSVQAELVKSSAGFINDGTGRPFK